MKYDGVLGVLGGMEAAKRLKGTTKHPIQVVAFYDEEDSMSGSIGFSQSKSVYDIKAFLELHVEQGPVLDKRGADIGVVEGIVGQEGVSSSGWHWSGKSCWNHTNGNER